MTTTTQTRVERLEVAAHEIPTDAPESDGTLEWESTTIVVVQVHADGATYHLAGPRGRPADGPC